jgi:hypothetical protein
VGGGEAHTGGDDSWSAHSQTPFGQSHANDVALTGDAVGAREASGQSAQSSMVAVHAAPAAHG